MRQELMLFCVILAATPGLQSQSLKSLDQGELIETLLARIENLESRMAELERKQRAAQAPVSVESSTTPNSGGVSLNSTSRQESAAIPQQLVPDLTPTYPSLKIAGFSDFNFSATDQPGSKSGFREGQFTLHFASPLSPRVSFFSEVTLTGRRDAGRGRPRAPGFNPEIERTIIRYDYSDQFKVSFGRYHTFINWWNTAFHHGSWFQTTEGVPSMLGTIIPRHFVGGMVEGTVPAQGWNIGYNLGLGNGRDSVIGRAGDVADQNNHRAWMFNLFSRPDRFYGLQVGGSLYRDKITLEDGRDFREWITSGHVVWEKENPELIFEFANVNHREVGGNRSFNTQSFYVQAAYRLPWIEQRWKPYYRFEYNDISEGDPIFQALRNLRGSIVGLRYDLTTFAAFKFEFRHQRRPGQSNVNGIFLQNSFTF